MDEESEDFTEELSGSEQEQSAGEEEEASTGEQSDEGARRWKGRRRRRGGRRGGRFDREGRPETTPEPEKAVEAAPAPRVEPKPELRSDFRNESRNDSRRDFRNDSRGDSRPPQEYGPPAGYTPIILPGESISKYRNLPQQAAEAEAPSAVEVANDGVASMPVEDFVTPEMVSEEIQEESLHLDEGYDVTETETVAAVETEQVEAAVPVAEEKPKSKRRWGWRRKAAEAAAEAAAAEKAQAEAARHEAVPVAEAENSLSLDPAAVETATMPAWNETAVDDQHHSDSTQTSEAEQQHVEAVSDHENRYEHLAHHADEHEVETPEGNFELPRQESAQQEHTHETHPSVEQAHPEQQAAPSSAPEGRTLEHEVLEDEEMDYHPVPDDLNAMSEVAGDEELVLEEETLEAGNTFERWVPKIEDVDEDEVVAAEERGENIFAAGEEEEDEEDEVGEGEETNGRAELRAVAPTAAYQQRNVEQRPGHEPRRGGRFDRDRGRRGGGGPRRNMRSRPNSSRNQPLISDLLKEGQEVLIQIAKEPIGKKGARITSHIALPGRFLVYMPTVNHVGVSRKIASDEERQRLKRIVTSERENGLGGFIVRTAAANIKEDELRADIRFLKHLWAEIKTRAENSKSPALIYHDLNLVERVLRDQVNADFSQIWVDTEDEYERVVRFASRFQPSLVRRIKLYTKETPLFEEFAIQDEINRSLKSKVWLKSGGHIVINQTEALVAIDVNTGKFVGKTQRLEDTIVKVNVDAIKEIVRQIRLRDLGGIIVIDFIDMDERKNRQKVMMALEEALRSDRAPSKVLQFNDFGLVAITRKRVKQSLERTLGEPCPYCTGAGFVKSVPTVCNELYIEMRKMTRGHDGKDIMVRVNPEVAKTLKANNGKLIGELEELTGKAVLVKSDPALHQEMFDIH
jgi:ribonuclease G